jgi:glycosyltransferase involved in cell wall biosynthesis
MEQDYPYWDYEILVVDNGSTDNTRKIVEKMIAFKSGHNIKYIFEPEPGLLSGRHRGAFEANGEVLIFVDDDVEAIPGWLPAIIRSFADNSVHLVGGPSLPKFEAEPPAWLKKFWMCSKGKIMCVPLSISYLSYEKIKIDPCYIWGLNFAIRKKTLFNLGGFHPDCIPKHLQHFQGDGETGLSLKIKEKDLKAIYDPSALLYHNIPKERLTVAYFEDRFYYQGVCDSFTQIRKNSGAYNIDLPKYCSNHRNGSHLPAYDRYKQIVYNRIHNAYVNGFVFHQDIVKNSEIMLEWVLRENYLFDYKLPIV